jgi:hypothetical protein
MSFFAQNAQGVRYGVLIDVGSGSVLVSIVKSDQVRSYPDIIWAKREYVPLRSIDSISDCAKYVMTSLVNALMLLDSEGRKVFLEKTGQKKLPHVQVTIAAPWSYTITKTISYGHTDSFTLSDELVDELLRTAHQKVSEDLVEHEKENQLGLSVITRCVIGLQANGYFLQVPNEQKVKSLKVVETSAIAQDYLIKALAEACEKILPQSTPKLYSFILIFYTILRDLQPETQEFCLVDVTYEATELGIVREGLLNYTTHTPFGTFSLAREIANILEVPTVEAFGYLHAKDPLTLIVHYSELKRAAVAKVFIAYQERLTKLFFETGDSLAIPKKIFLHGSSETESFLASQLSIAARNATAASHAVYPITEELLIRTYDESAKAALQKSAVDTALLISAQFFHTGAGHRKFEHPL